MRFARCVDPRAGGMAGMMIGMALMLVLSLVAAQVASGAEGRPTSTNYVAGRGGGANLVTPAATAAELLQCLLGPDVIVTNAVLTAAPQAAGTFVGGLNVVGFDQGIILSSGDVARSMDRMSATPRLPPTWHRGIPTSIR